MSTLKHAAALALIASVAATQSTHYARGGYGSYYTKRTKRKGERYYQVDGAERRVSRLTRNC
jgi:hypothetical protein